MFNDIDGVPSDVPGLKFTLKLPILDNRACLRVKLKSLAEEGKIIKHEIKRTTRVDLQCTLQVHRTLVVRSEARHTLLAYGFLRGKKYLEIEHKAKEQPNFDKIRKMVEKHGIQPYSYSFLKKYNKEGKICGDMYDIGKKLVIKQGANFEVWVKEATDTFKKQN